MRILFLLLSALFSLGLSAQTQTYSNYLDSIDRYVGDRNWGAAEVMLNKALKTEPANPNNYILLSNLGTVYRNMKKYDEALSFYNRALAITPNAVTIIHNRAALYLEMDSTKAAYKDYARIMNLDKNDVDSRYYHGMISMEYGDLESAKADFVEAMSIDKKNLNAKRGMAIWYKVNGDFESAVALYNEIILEENRFANYIGRAECHLELGKLTEADADISEAQKLDPSNPDVFLLKARTAELYYRYDDAINYAKKALELGADAELVEKFIKKLKI